MSSIGILAPKILRAGISSKFFTLVAAVIIGVAGCGEPADAARSKSTPTPAPVTPAAGGQILNNVGFEANGTTGAVSAPGWSYYIPPTASVTYALDTASPHGGLTSQRIIVGSGETSFLQAPLAFQTGQKYAVSIWLKAQKPTRVQLGLKRMDNGFGYALKTVIVPTTWTQYGMYGYTDTTNGQFMITVQEPGTVWIDDVNMVAIGDPLKSSVPATRAVPKEFFGQHMHQYAASWSWPTVPFGARRLWDTTGAGWSAVSSCAQVRTDGQCNQAVTYNWNTMDARVNEAGAHGVDLMMNLGTPPTWASARPTEASPYGPGKSAEPMSDQVWRDWVTTVATRYKGKIKYWEIWNEPNFHWNKTASSFYTGTPEKLLSLQQQAYSILKAIDPSNVVLTPAFTDTDYAEYYLSIGGGYSADVVAYHFYVLGAPEGIYQYYARTIQNLAATKTPGLPVWNTEQGWIGSAMDANLGAAYLARSYVLNWASNVSRYYWYAWDNPNMAVKTTLADNITMTPAGIAYGQVANWLIGQQLASLTIDASGNWVAALTDPTGSRGSSYIVWNPAATGTATVNFTVPSGWQVSRSQSLMGVTGSASAGSVVRVNYSPMLLSR